MINVMVMVAWPGFVSDAVIKMVLSLIYHSGLISHVFVSQSIHQFFQTCFILSLGSLCLHTGRRLSGEMISVNEFMVSNKVSLALLQKQLSEAARQGPRQSLRSQGLAGASLRCHRVKAG